MRNALGSFNAPLHPKPEGGEITDSLTAPHDNLPINLQTDARPLCRFLVQQSDVLRLGSVVVVDSYETLLVGRDRQRLPQIRLKELAVSKHHAYIFWDEETTTWSLVDNGSVHGTFITSNAKSGPTVSPDRLSPPRTASLPRSLHDGDQVTIGSTTFGIHIHHDGTPCVACDSDETVKLLTDAKSKPQNLAPALHELPETGREDARIALQRLKNTLLKAPTYSTKRTIGMNPASAYTDRAKRRRQTTVDYGVQVHETATQSTATASSQAYRKHPSLINRQLAVLESADGQTPQSASASPVTTPFSSEHNTPVHAEPLDSCNVGHKLLMKQGWKVGEALGNVTRSDRSALREPLKVRLLERRAGLGSQNSDR